MVSNFAKTQERREFCKSGPCSNCGNSWDALDCHEILAGSNRHKSWWERACWLRLCREPCHRIVQGADIPWQLALKLLNDPEGFDLEKFHEAWDRPITAVTAEDVLVALRGHLISKQDEGNY